MASGGPRTPKHPAPVSGPGALSRRTDGGPGNAKQPIRVPTGGNYGDATASLQTQQGAPMAASPGGDQAGGTSPGLLAGLGLPEGPGLDQGTQRPDEPVTAGADLGPGPGTAALNMTPQSDEDIKRLVQYLPVLEHMANQPGASSAARNLVRQLKGAV
jgi:hypothetical protein